MAVLNLRDVPDGLYERLKMAAARAGRSKRFHAFCVELLERSVDARGTGETLTAVAAAREPGRPLQRMDSPADTVESPAPDGGFDIEITE